MVNDLVSMFEESARRNADRVAFKAREGGEDFEDYTFAQVLEMALDLATGLAALGLNPGDKVGILSDNRVEWIIADFAILMNGAADVPRGSDSTRILCHALFAAASPCRGASPPGLCPPT